MISVLCNVDRSELLLVHKLLEGIITGFLEHHLVGETVADELIDFSLELKEFLGESQWVLDV